MKLPSRIWKEDEEGATEGSSRPYIGGLRGSGLDSAPKRWTFYPPGGTKQFTEGVRSSHPDYIKLKGVPKKGRGGLGGFARQSLLYYR